MPLKINVGLSRKISQDYQSKGFSLNIEGELPANVIDDPDTMSVSVDQLFELANRLLDEQVDKAGAGSRPTSHNGIGNGNGRSDRYRQSAPVPRPVNGHRRREGNGTIHRALMGRSAGDGPRRLITQAQSKAVENMAKRLGYDPQAVSHEEFGNPVNELTVKQASDLIDLLRRDIEAKPAEGRA